MQVLPAMTSAATSTCWPWQMAAMGFFAPRSVS
jgi:hypothetical protein